MRDHQFVYANTPEQMMNYVKDLTKVGWDLYGGIIPTMQYFGQCLLRTTPLHEYKLVNANDFRTLDQQCDELRMDGFEFYMFTTVWNSVLFQWMCRAKERDLRWVEQATFNTALQAGPAVRLIPNILAGAPPLMVEGGRVVEFPSQAKNSTE